MYKRNNYKMYIIGSIALSVIALTGLIYAAFTGQLNIRGTSVNRHSKWDVHFENLSNITTTHTAKVLDNNEPKIGDDLLSITDYDVSLTTPGDSISFTFDVVNEGNYNAKITDIVINTPECTGSDETSNNNVCKNIKYELTRSTGASIEEDEIVYAKDHLSLKVTLTYKDTVTADELATSDVSISNLGIRIDFEQSSDALVKDNGEVITTKVYHIGDKVTLNQEDYWVIADSPTNQDYVVALKDIPLTVEEVNLYGGVGTENNHVNKYTQGSVGTAYNSNGYGGVAYYTSSTCGYVNSSEIKTGCTNNYNESDIKHIVDNWASSMFTNNELATVDGANSRLITISELRNLGYVQSGWDHLKTNSTPIWLYSEKYSYWTMNSLTTSYLLCAVLNTSVINSAQYTYHYFNTIRPVINVYKSALENNNG